MLWIPIGLFSVALGVIGALIDKYLLEKYFGDDPSENAGPGALIIFSGYFAALIVLCIFLYGYSDIHINAFTTGIAIVAGVLNGIWILCYLYAVKRSDLSIVVSILQIVPIFGLIVGFVFLNELLSQTQIIAALIIIFGALVLLHQNGGSLFNFDRYTLLLMITASALIAVSQMMFKFVALDSNYVTAAFWLWSGFVFFAIFLHTFSKSYREEFTNLFAKRIKSVMTTNSLNEVVDNMTELVFFAAIIIGPLALVQSLNAYEPAIMLLASILAARLLPQYFDEDVSRSSLLQKALGITIITLGSIALYQAML